MRNKHIIHGILLLLIILVISCNIPIASRYSYPITDLELRQTLEAQFGTNESSQDKSAQITQTPYDHVTVNHTSTTTPIGTIITTPGLSDYENPGEYYYYAAQSGDTLDAIAKRFNVEPYEITSPEPLRPGFFLSPGQQLAIPNTLNETLPANLLLPDSEVVYSIATINFDVGEFIEKSGGYLRDYEETVDGDIVSGTDIVERVAIETSVNPMFLLAFLEHRSQWVTSQPSGARPIEYPIGFRVPGYKGLYKELLLTSTHLSAGYYGWRTGNLTEIEFPDQSSARLNPTLNAGSVALLHLMALFYQPDMWKDVLYAENNFNTLYISLFGDPWSRAEKAGPIFPVGLEQPTLELPFPPGERWSLTGGPHHSWNSGNPRGALDFSPVTREARCAVSKAWVTSSTAGIVVRAENNVVVIDVDGDGYEQSGWTIVYLHIADKEMVSTGTWLDADEPIGHPSCEGGRSTGTHVHIARKYNGEWLFSDSPLPFILSGWQVRVGERNYQGELIKGEKIIYSNPNGNQSSIIVR